MYTLRNIPFLEIAQLRFILDQSMQERGHESQDFDVYINILKKKTSIPEQCAKLCILERENKKTIWFRNEIDPGRLVVLIAMQITIRVQS